MSNATITNPDAREQARIRAEDYQRAEAACSVARDGFSLAINGAIAACDNAIRAEAEGQTAFEFDLWLDATGQRAPTDAEIDEMERVASSRRGAPHEV